MSTETYTCGECSVDLVPTERGWADEDGLQTTDHTHYVHLYQPKDDDALRAALSADVPPLSEIAFDLVTEKAHDVSPVQAVLVTRSIDMAGHPHTIVGTYTSLEAAQDMRESTMRWHQRFSDSGGRETFETVLMKRSVTVVYGPWEPV